MPHYRSTNGRPSRPSDSSHPQGARGRARVQTHAQARPRRSALPYVLAAVVILLVAAIVAVGVFGLGKQGKAAQPQDAAAPTSFTEAAPSEQVAVADDVVMTLAGSAETYVLAGEEYLEAGCRAVDPDFGNITDSVSVSGNVDASTPGDYKVTYTATTQDGAKAQAVRNVHVVEAFDAPAKDVPVLMYHYVYTESDVPDDLNNNYILDTKLAAECEYLRDNGYYYPSYQELRAWIDGTHTLPAKSVVLTFDDGQEGFLKYGIPVLEEYQVPATSFVIAKDAAQNVITYASPYVQFESHSYNMHRGGGGAGQGGIIHALSQQEIYDDIMASNEVTGGPGAVAFAYPFGDNNEAAWAALDEAGILCAFTVKNDRINVGDNPMALNRVRLSGEYSVDSFVNLVEPSA